jgi:hypothetical protein
MQRWRWPILLFLSTVIVRLIGISAESLWYDEGYSAWVAQLPLPQLIQATAGDVHPPLWYLINWSIGHLFGYSEFALRFPAAIFSGLATTELYLLIKKSADHKAAIIGSVFMIFSAGMQYYGQEARMYSLMTWLVLLATRSLQEDKKSRFAPALGLLMYTQNLGAIYAAPLGLIALTKWRKQSLLPLGLAGAAYLPWLGVLLSQLSSISDGYWIVPESPGGMFFYWLYGSFGNRLPDFAQLHMVIASSALTITSLYMLRRNGREYLPLLAISLLPSLELFAISEIWHPVMLPRALLPASAGLMGIWGSGITKMSKAGRYAALAIAGGMFALSLGNYFTDESAQRFPVHEHVQVITEGWEDHDAVYHMNTSSVLTVGYYLSEYPNFALPQTRSLAQGLSDQTKLAMGLKEKEVSIDQLTAQGYERLWVLRVLGPAIGADELARGEDIVKSYPVLREITVKENQWFALKIYLLDIRGDRYGMVQ